MEKKNNLPVGWEQVKLSEIAIINPPKPNTVSDDLDVSFIPMKCVEELTGQIDLNIVKKYHEVKRGFTSFSDGDIIFAKITPCMENGKIAIVHNLKNGIGLGSTEFHVIRMRDKEISQRLYFWYLLQDNFRTNARQEMKGTAGQLRVPSDYLKEVMIPLPPLNEQKRIVEKIEELFSLLDNYEMVLMTSKSKLTRCINSVFQNSLSGELTTSWRLQNSSDFSLFELSNIKNFQEKDLKKINPEDLQILPKIPSTWSWIRLGKICLVKDVDHKMPKAIDDGIPFVSTKDFLDDGTIDFRNTKKISPTDFISNTKKIEPKLGDILFSRYGTLGKVILVPDKKFGLSYSIAVIRPIFDKINLNWLHLILQSPFVLHQAIKGEQSSTMADLGLITIRNFLIPLPSFSEQQIIATTLDGYVSNFNNQLKQIEANIKLSKNLRNSILKQAFEGKLVPQDPNDEPTSELLKRIKLYN